PPRPPPLNLSSSGTRTPSLSRSLFFFSRARRRLCSAQASELCLMACAFFFDAEPLGEPGLRLHGPELELDACALCTKPLQGNSDIFMYKGDTPFCSEDCRYEQMHFDLVAPHHTGLASRNYVPFLPWVEEGGCGVLGRPVFLPWHPVPIDQSIDLQTLGNRSRITAGF
uniref:FLZ-type domain-containing protein n=1 Tax=Aegilops tauschii subsp. strangulata TaxID=200361 RepID=A0A453CXP6_AEGTS